MAYMIGVALVTMGREDWLQRVGLPAAGSCKTHCVVNIFFRYKLDAQDGGGVVLLTRRLRQGYLGDWGCED
jgi:hypothetical protein